MHTTVPQQSTRRQVLRAGFAAAIGSWAAVEVLGAGQASAAPVPPPEVAAGRISMVGDSLTCGTLPFQADDFSAAGWAHSAIDAYVSRGVRTKIKADRYTGLTAVDAIREKSGDSLAWIIGLGTNDSVIYSHNKQAEVIAMMMEHIGSDHKVMWVNVYLPERLPLQLAWNTALDEAAQQSNGDMVVLDWASVAAQNEHWLAHDHIHYSRDGYRSRSTVIGQASRDLRVVESGPQLLAHWKLPARLTKVS